MGWPLDTSTPELRSVAAPMPRSSRRAVLALARPRLKRFEFQARARHPNRRRLRRRRLQTSQRITRPCRGTPRLSDAERASGPALWTGPTAPQSPAWPSSPAAGSRRRGYSCNEVHPGSLSRLWLRQPICRAAAARRLAGWRVTPSDHYPGLQWVPAGAEERAAELGQRGRELAAVAGLLTREAESVGDSSRIPASIGDQ